MAWVKTLPITELTTRLAEERDTSVLCIELRHTPGSRRVEAESHAHLRDDVQPRLEVLQAVLVALQGTYDYYMAEFQQLMRQREAAAAEFVARGQRAQAAVDDAIKAAMASTPPKPDSEDSK